jgi:hypothetical protein
MKPKSLAICLLATVMLVFTTSVQSAEKDNVKIIEIKVDQSPMPQEVVSGGSNKVLAEDWHMIQVKFSTEEELTEEIQVKFFLEAFDSKKQDQFVVLTSDVTFINIPKGLEHTAMVYLTPGSALRYVGKKAKNLKDNNVHVDILENGRVVAQQDKKTDEANWYASAQQINSVLVALVESHFWPSESRRVNQIKVRN